MNKLPHCTQHWYNILYNALQRIIFKTKEETAQHITEFKRSAQKQRANNAKPIPPRVYSNTGDWPNSGRTRCDLGHCRVLSAAIPIIHTGKKNENCISSIQIFSITKPQFENVLCVTLDIILFTKTAMFLLIDALIKT